MKINGIDIRKYDAKQLTADVQPPSFANSYEWLTGATLPTEFETEVQMGHLKLSIYFKGKDRNNSFSLMNAPYALSLITNFVVIAKTEEEIVPTKSQNSSTGFDKMSRHSFSFFP